MVIARRICRSLFFALCLGAALSAEPLRGDLDIPNLGRVKADIRAYVSDGRYQDEAAEVARGARQYLERNLPRFENRKPAIVLDIDETSVSNYPLFERLDFGYIPAEWDRWVSQGEAKALPATFELYQFARSKGVAVFFLSARDESEREQTVQNLSKAGYTEYQELILKNESSPHVSADYKAEQRRRLTEQGWSIVVNLGDQLSDLQGGYAEGAFKLPNPMYFIP